MQYSQQRELKLYDHIIGCFCQVNTPWSLSKSFAFSFCVNTAFIMVSVLCVCTHSPGWPQHEAFTGWAERWDLGEQHKSVRGEENEEANMTIQVSGCDSMPAAICGPWGLLTTEKLEAGQLRRQSCKRSHRALQEGAINPVIHHCALLCPGGSLPSSLLIHKPSSVLLLWN